jgi:hypothetical protein
MCIVLAVSYRSTRSIAMKFREEDFFEIGDEVIVVDASPMYPRRISIYD